MRHFRIYLPILTCSVLSASALGQIKSVERCHVVFQSNDVWAIDEKIRVIGENERTIAQGRVVDFGQKKGEYKAFIEKRNKRYLNPQCSQAIHKKIQKYSGPIALQGVSPEAITAIIDFGSSSLSQQGFHADEERNTTLPGLLIGLQTTVFPSRFFSESSLVDEFGLSFSLTDGWSNDNIIVKDILQKSGFLRYQLRRYEAGIIYQYFLYSKIFQIEAHLNPWVKQSFQTSLHGATEPDVQSPIRDFHSQGSYFSASGNFIFNNYLSLTLGAGLGFNNQATTTLRKTENPNNQEVDTLDSLKMSSWNVKAQSIYLAPLVLGLGIKKRSCIRVFIKKNGGFVFMKSIHQQITMAAGYHF